MRNYFIKYNPRDRVNYIYLFMLYGIAEYNKKTMTYNIITYNTKKELAAKINNTYNKDNGEALSYSTLVRVLNNAVYNDYFTVQDNSIILNNSFSKYSKNSEIPFVILTNKEADFLIQNKDNLLARYYIYLKYYCGLAAKAGTIQNFTAKQFLSSIGMSVDNHNNLSKISSYNNLLSSSGFIEINKYRDKNGNERNSYKLLSVLE